MKKLIGFLAVVLLPTGLLTACGSNSNGDPLSSNMTEEPTGSSGSWTINMVGGSGEQGGSGGYWYIETYQQQGVKIAKSGTAATGFTIPAYNPPTDLGTNGKTIFVTTSVPVYASGATQTTSGVLYLVKGDNKLYESMGSGTVPGSSPVVTGLRVNPGVTLTLGLNHDTDGNGSMDETLVTFSNDVDIAGTLKTTDLLSSSSTDTREGAAPTARDMGALDLESLMQIFIRSTGSIITKGLNGSAAGERGGDGGYIKLSAGNYFINQGTIDNSGGDGFDVTPTSATDGGSAGVISGSTPGISSLEYHLEIYVDGGSGPGSEGPGGGVFINRGRINARGGTGGSGGLGARVTIFANSDVFNTGPVTLIGGKGTRSEGGVGGNGGDCSVTSAYGSIYNSGALTTAGRFGGSFMFMAGAPGINMQGYSGDIVNSGSIAADGGDISMYAYGAIKTSGKISSNGGDCAEVSIGGNGGKVLLQNYVPTDFGSGNQLPVRPIQVSGNIYLNGGACMSGTGGAAGGLFIYQAESGAAESNTGVALLGYAAADLSGGYGTTNGGGGQSFGVPSWNGTWSVEIYTYNDYPGNGNAPLPPGPLTNQMNITAKGGSSKGLGGPGGWGITMETVGTVSQNNYFGPGGISILTNTGKLDTSGGSGGTDNGGDAGPIYLLGHDGVTNSGSLIARGGDTLAGTGGTGGSGGVKLFSSLNITNAGPIDTTGGRGAIGGNGSLWANGTPFGAWVQLNAGGKVTNTGRISCLGGAGSTKNGNGGGIDMLSEVGGTSNSGALIVSAGTGTGLPGTKGQAWLDWAQVK